MVDKLTFISTTPHLSKIEECQPKPSSRFTPNWWKNTDTNTTSVFQDGIDFGNVKNCPSFADYFSQGYCIPMWEDSVISFNKQTQQWFWRAANKGKWEYHTPEQFVNIAEPVILNKRGYAVFKAVSPWQVFTPVGYSVLAMPMFYQFNTDFTALPGVLHSDVRHSLNIQILFHSDKETVYIKKGTPLVQYMPFRRNDVLDMEYRDASKEDLDNIELSDLQYDTSLSAAREYIKQRKEVDKKISGLDED
jgi:hypothetical protein